MWDLIIFAVIGLLAGAASRLFYPGRATTRVMATMLLGIGGSLLGGLVSWAIWPAVDGQLYAGALLTSLLGAVLVLVVWPCFVYVRSISVPRNRIG